MPEPVIVTISHRLGRDGAKHRIDEALGRIRGQLTPFASSVDYRWNGYRLDFDVMAMRQRVVGRIDVEDDIVRVEIGLPLLLRLLSSRIAGRVRDEASLLLDKPAVR